MLRDLCVAARRLLRDRWSTAAAILVAALGAGLNTAVFAFAYGVLLRPLPYRDAEHLGVVHLSVPFDRVDAWRRELSTFEEIAGYTREGLTVRGLTEPRFVPVAVVTDTFFDTLGTPPRAGRTFVSGDSVPVAVISERIARQAASSIESLLGRSITVGDVAVTVIGTMPDAFAFPAGGVDVWIPARAVSAIAFDRTSDARRFRLIGRVTPGLTLAQSRADLQGAREALDPEWKRGSTPNLRVQSLYDMVVGPVRPVLLAFTAAGIIVLLIACANVATILIGRTVMRRRELAIRAALGASRVRLFMTTVSESILIALSGAGLGAALAVGAVRVMGAWAAGILPRLGEVHVDWRVLAFTLVVAALSSIVAAVPALRTIGASMSLRAGVHAPAGARLRALLAVSQIALAVVLLGAAGLLGRTIVGLLRADIGVEPRGALVSELMVSDATNFGVTGKQQWMENLLQRVRAIPNTTAAGVGSSLPPDNAPIAISVRLVTGNQTTETPEMSLASVTPGYLQALGTPLVRGRYFEEADGRRGDLVAVLSESAARAVMPNQDPVGKPLPMALPGSRERGHATVLGVVADVKYSGLEATAGPAIYVLWKDLPAGQLYLAVRTTGDSRAAASALRAVLRGVDPRLPLMPIRRLSEVMQRSVADRRLRALLGGGMAMLACAIAVVGLAGGLGRLVSERRRELAIRAALGATPARALQAVMRDGAILAAAGVTAGTLITLTCGTLLRSLVLGVSPHDPLTLCAVAGFVAAASLLACYLPARQAATANPLDALRDN
jgi:putative ABC transport system permease protein